MDAFKIIYLAAPAGVLRNTAAYFWEMVFHYPNFFVTQPIIQAITVQGKEKTYFVLIAINFFLLDFHPCLMEL